MIDYLTHSLHHRLKRLHLPLDFVLKIDLILHYHCELIGETMDAIVAVRAACALGTNRTVS